MTGGSSTLLRGAEPHDEETRRHPRNPWIGFFFAALYLCAAGLAAVALGDQFDRVIGFDISGQRTEGFLLFTPVVFAALGLFTLVRAWRAVRPWNRYRARVDLTQRRIDRALDLDGQARWPLALLGVFALTAFWVLFLSTPTSAAGWLLLVELQVLALLAATALLGLLAQCFYYAKFLPAAKR